MTENCAKTTEQGEKGGKFFLSHLLISQFSNPRVSDFRKMEVYQVGRD